MSKHGKPVTKHIVGLGDVTSYADVPDAKEANMHQQRPEVHISGGHKEATVSVGDEYHSRPATAEELKSATAKAIAEKSLKAAVAPAPIDRSAIADSIAKAVAQGSKGANGMPVGAATTKKVGPNDMPVTGEEADNAPPGASAKKRASVPVVSETDHDITVEVEVDKVEPVDERYGYSATTASRKVVTTKMKSIAADERVYIPSLKGIGVVTKSDLDKLTVEMENNSVVVIDASEVTPLGNVNLVAKHTGGKGGGMIWAGAGKYGKKKKKKVKKSELWMPRAVVVKSGTLDWEDHAPMEWIPQGPYQKADGTPAWLPSAVEKAGGKYVWVEDEDAEDIRMTWAGGDAHPDIRMTWAGAPGEEEDDSNIRMTWAGAPEDDPNIRMTWAGAHGEKEDPHIRMTWAGGPLEWLPKGKSWAGLATKSDAMIAKHTGGKGGGMIWAGADKDEEELEEGYAKDAKKKEEEKD